MKLKQTNLHILHQEQDLGKEAKTGVSLHCHTQFSKEMLDFVPHYAEKIPIVSYYWKKEQEKFIKREGRKIDFATAYWSPPMPEKSVYNLEKNHLNKFGLEAIISITDHDCINANLNLCDSVKTGTAPISMEWTVPYKYGFFHLGVHNLPKNQAIEITEQLLDFTFAKERQLDLPENHLTELFAMLTAIPDVLIVFNHPIWDIEMVGKELHEILLKDFIKDYGQWIHAFEINGFRSWSENKKVIEMAEALGIPLVTGGDRHGCSPNTVINLTNTKTFSEFADEIRVDKHSEVALLPEYHQPLLSRQLQSFSEILASYPEFTDDRQRWFDRLYYDRQDGSGLQKLSFHWDKGGPTWLRMAISTLTFLGHKRLRPFFNLTRDKADFVPKNVSQTNFVIPDLDDLMPKISSETAQGTTGFAS